MAYDGTVRADKIARIAPQLMRGAQADCIFSLLIRGAAYPNARVALRAAISG